MNINNSCILAINGGSSTIKFALYQMGEPLKRLLNGKIDIANPKGSMFRYHIENDMTRKVTDLEITGQKHPATFLIDWIENQEVCTTIKAIGHRVVHGMYHTEPTTVSSVLLEELHRYIPYDPDHLPGELEMIESIRNRKPALLQVACFDTAFHTSMPRVAQMLPIPRKYEMFGIRRYGFHGISYAYLMEELERVAGKKAAHKRVILAQLGNGVSMAAVKEGKSMDTTMGFTPSSGLMMSTRSGDLDPGVACFMMKSEKLSPKQFSEQINKKSGLLGVSETNADMRELLKIESKDIRAAEAIDLFCYEARKSIGALSAVLGGLDTLVFSGGMGENAPVIRSRICQGLKFTGIVIDETLNEQNAAVISTNSCKATVRVIHTNEEWMIAKTVARLINSEKIKVIQL